MVETAAVQVMACLAGDDVAQQQQCHEVRNGHERVHAVSGVPNNVKADYVAHKDHGDKQDAVTQHPAFALDIDKSNDFGLSVPAVVVMLGHSEEIGILNGNGNYSIVGGSDIVNCELNCNSLTVNGKSVGNTTVYVTDLAADTQVQLKVVVKDKDVITVNGVSFTMVAVEGGSFMMGANDDDTEAYDDEMPAHQVTLSSFCIGETGLLKSYGKP